MAEERKMDAPVATYTEGIRFSSLCVLLEKVQGISKAQKKIDMLFTAPLLLARQRGETLFPLMRLLLPQLDRHRNAYGLKERTIASLYVELLGLSSRSRDYDTLKNYRDPTKAGYGHGGSAGHVGDFGATLEVVLKKRAGGTSNLTIADVNQLLDELYRAPSTKDKKSVLQKVLTTCSALEQKWIIRIVLKDLKIGLKHERVLKYYHPDAMEAYNANTNLEAVCADPSLRNPSVRTKQEIQLTVPFKPMLCKRKHWKSGDRIMGSSVFFIEDKMDGERMLLHKKGGQVHIFSRNCTDYADYAEIMRRYVLQLVDAEDCILDGEMMAWNEDEKRYNSFGHNRTIMLEEKTNPDARNHMCYVAFDILWLTGRDDIPEGKGCIADLRLDQRKEILSKVVHHREHRLEVLPFQTVCASSAEKRLEAILTRFQSAIDDRKEGIVMKESSSKYLCSSRDDKWVKLKPDYMEGYNKRLDCLILGGYYGDGRRRSGQVSHFLLGLAATDRQQTGENPTEFVVFTKVGSGYNRDELNIVQARLEGHWNRVADANQAMPPFMMGWRAAKRDDVPDVVIDDPRNSILLEVYGAELVPTTQFSSKHTLRFPRVECVRTDKDWFEADSIQFMHRLLKENDGKTAMNPGDGKVAWSRVTKKQRRNKKRAAPRRVVASVMQEYQGADVSRVERTSCGGFFEGQEMCVMADDYRPFKTTKADLERAIHLNHGTFVQNPMSSTKFVIAASGRRLKVANLVKTNERDVVCASWLLACISSNALLPIEPRYLIHMCPTTRLALASTFDAFGDHYTRPATVEDVRVAFAVAQRKRQRRVTPMDLPDLVASLEPSEQRVFITKYTIFRDCVVYVHGYSADGLPTADRPIQHTSALMRTVLLIRMFAGRVVNDLTPESIAEVTHVLMDDVTRDEVDAVQGTLEAASRSDVPILNHTWATKSVDAGSLLPQDEFMLVAPH